MNYEYFDAAKALELTNKAHNDITENVLRHIANACEKGNRNCDLNREELSCCDCDYEELSSETKEQIKSNLESKGFTVVDHIVYW